MKKNSMRIAALLLALVMLTTAAVGGTFAKYITTDSSSDSARVAKFGVTVTAPDSSSFETSYNAENADEAKMEITVNSANNEDLVVAPGTKNEEKAIKFTITGQPEVAVNVNIDMEVKKDIVVPAGNYNDYTKPEDQRTEKFNVAKDYHPVVFTLTCVNTELGVNETKEGTLAEIESWLEGRFNGDYAPNTPLNITCTLSWAWAFPTEADESLDKADTLLGWAAVGGENTIEGVSTDLEYTFGVTVTQID